eukprot:5968105-Alexandrium_andersonii.AAC.1
MTSHVAVVPPGGPSAFSGGVSSQPTMAAPVDSVGCLRVSVPPAADERRRQAWIPPPPGSPAGAGRT